MTSCLLTYSVLPSPNNPILISPEKGDPSVTDLTITVSNSGDTEIYCKEIRFHFDIGSLAQNLTEIGGGIEISATPSENWTYIQDQDGNFTFKAKTEQARLITEDGVTFRIANIVVNRQVGTFNLTIGETSSANDESNYEDRSLLYPLAKFPYGFYMTDLVAIDSVVDPGGSTKLTWKASENAAYQLEWTGGSVDVTKVREYPVDHLNNDTTFYLTATAQSPSGSTVRKQISYEVSVRKPDVLTFTASNTVIKFGDYVTLNWTNGVNTDSCKLFSNGHLIQDNLLPNGQFMVQPTPVEHDYELVGYYKGYASVGKKLSITIQTDDQATFTVAPTTTYPGQEVLVTWATPPNTPCTINLTNVTNTGSLKFYPTTSSLYALSYATAGVWSEKKQQVTVLPPDQYFINVTLELINQQADGSQVKDVFMFSSRGVVNYSFTSPRVKQFRGFTWTANDGIMELRQGDAVSIKLKMDSQGIILQWIDPSFAPANYSRANTLMKVPPRT